MMTLKVTDIRAGRDKEPRYIEVNDGCTVAGFKSVNASTYQIRRGDQTEQFFVADKDGTTLADDATLTHDQEIIIK